MTPWDLIVWAVAASGALVIVGLGAAMAWALVASVRSSDK